MTAASERLSRLLELVPYLLRRPGAVVADVAADFGVGEQQLRRDLELLWMCGLPGYGPGDLIDLSFEADRVTVTDDAGMRRPLRLTASEATSLLVALRALAETPGVADPAVVRRALAKVESATGRARSADEDGVVVGLSDPGDAADPEVFGSVRRAIELGYAVWIRYYTASRDGVSDRIVDPVRMVLIDGRHYLEGWCRRAEDVRLFRLDRVDAVAVTDEPARAVDRSGLTDFSAGLFPPRSGHQAAVLRLAPQARWVAEYYVMDEVTELSGGWVRVRMRFVDRAWMERLVLGLGGRAVVESPEELAGAVRRRAEAALLRARHVSAP